MPYVEPNSVADFFTDTGLSMSHENTLYFASAPVKDQYFTDLSGKISVDHVSYQREHRGWIRVELPMSRLYNVDYMRFRNVSFENKYFYAFVTAINYINNLTTEVQYVLDPLMTWMGNFTLKQCFVERQHVSNDAIGANICDEGLSTGTYVEEATEYGTNYGTSNAYIRIQYADPNEIKANTWGGIYNPTTFYDESSASGAATRIANIVAADLTDNIVNVYMVPNDFANPGSLHSATESVSKPYSTVAGYTPKNNKLFVYPYKYLEVDNSEGDTKQFKYEYFNTLPDATSSGNCEFTVIGTSVNNVEVSLAPNDYNGHSGANQSDRISMSHFPQCAWAIDNYKAYLAQKNAYFVHDTVSAGVNGFVKGVQNELVNETNPSANASAALMSVSGMGLAGAGLTAAASLMSGLESGLLNIGGQVANHMVDNLIQPEAGSRVSGSPSTDLQFSNNTKRFTFHKMSITKNYAIMIDNYFTMFGYAVKQVLTPNMNARPHWTYVKTIGCDCGGNVPASDKKLIEQIFDNGVRFWHNLSEMGNYSLDNSPA